MLSILFPRFENKILKIKYNTLISYVIFLFFLTFFSAYAAIINQKDSFIFIYSSITSVIFITLTIIFARKWYYVASYSFLILSWITTTTTQFFIIGDNSVLAFLMANFFVIATVAALSINWYTACIMAFLSMVVVAIDIYFENNNILNPFTVSPISSWIYFIGFSLLLSILILNVSVNSFSLYKTISDYDFEFTKRLDAEKDLNNKNQTLKELNVQLEENISALQENNERMVYAFLKAEESDKLKTSFLRNISHEIRTPLNAIIGFSTLLQEIKSKDLNKLEEYTNPIISSSEQLLSVVNGIIEISMIDAGIKELNNSVINVNEFVEEIFLNNQPKANRKGLTFKITTKLPEGPIYINIDKAKLKMVLNNLISNAIKFTHQGFIELQYSIINKTLYFEVKDTGIGIEKTNFELIFEKFRQVEFNISRKYEGLGIGLSICKEIVKQLDGKISLTSQPGVGSTFYITVPIEHLYVNTKKDKSESKNINNFDSLHILIAEDEPNNQALIKELFVATNAKLYHAANGQDALDIVKSNAEINLILMDIRMPVMDGIEAFAKIKEINPKLPVIAITAYAMENEKKEFIDMGFNGYLSKPFVKDELFSKINQVVDCG